MQPLFTAKQVKEILGISEPTIYRLNDAGILPAVEIVRRKRKRILRWRPETIENFIASRERK